MMEYGVQLKLLMCCALVIRVKLAITFVKCSGMCVCLVDIYYIPSPSCGSIKFAIATGGIL